MKSNTWMMLRECNGSNINHRITWCWVFESVLFLSLHVFLLGRLPSLVSSFCQKKKNHSQFFLGTIIPWSVYVKIQPEPCWLWLLSGSCWTCAAVGDRRPWWPRDGWWWVCGWFQGGCSPVSLSCMTIRLSWGPLHIICDVKREKKKTINRRQYDMFKCIFQDLWLRNYLEFCLWESQDWNSSIITVCYEAFYSCCNIQSCYTTTKMSIYLEDMERLPVFVMLNAQLSHRPIVPHCKQHTYVAYI